MKKLMMIAACAAVAMFAGCKSVKVKTPDWEASYASAFQQNDVKGLEVSKEGSNATVKVEHVKSALDPAGQDALRKAADALEEAAKAAKAASACAAAM